MAIAASKLGLLVAQEWHSEESLIRSLREKNLVRSDVPDILLTATVKQAREEHQGLPDEQREFNSPHERVRAFLDPYLTRKGKRWAVPIRSLTLDDHDDAGRSWWQFWKWDGTR